MPLVPETYPSKITKADFIAVAGAVNDKPDATVSTVVAAGGAAQTLTIPEGATDVAYDVTLTAACAFTLAGATASKLCAILLRLRQDSTGGRAVTLPDTVQFTGGGVPAFTQAANKGDLLSLITHDGGATWVGAFVATALASPGVPSAPVLSGAASQSSAQLTWPSVAATPSVTSYQIFRGTSPGASALLATVSGGTTSYLDSTAAAGSTYYYRIKAVSSAGASAFSNEVSVSTAAALVLDDPFTRPNSATSMGSSPQGGPWVNVVGTWGIINNQAYTVTAGASDLVLYDLSKTEQELSITLASPMVTDSSIALILRAADALNFYFISILQSAADGVATLIGKQVAGAFSTVAPGLQVPQPAGYVQGDVYTAAISGSTITVKRNGVVIRTVTDTSLTAGTKIGLRSSNNNNAAIRFDNAQAR